MKQRLKSVRVATRESAQAVIRASLVLVTFACGEQGSSEPSDIPQVPGQLEPAVPPPGYDDPTMFGFRYGFKGLLTRSGIGVGHLPPEAGEMDRVPWLWIGCFVRENAEASYRMVPPVEGSPLPCGFVWHENHLDAVVESQRAPLWQALIVVIVP